MGKLLTSVLLVVVLCASLWLIQSGLYFASSPILRTMQQQQPHELQLKQISIEKIATLASTRMEQEASPNWCTLEQLGVGTWDRSVIRKAPYCCFQNSRQKGCKPHPNIPSYMRRNQGCGNGCNCDMDAQYGPVWVPSAKCRLDAWNSSKFCERLGNKRLVFVGDSIADQFHLVLFNMLHEEKRRLEDTCVDRIIFRSSDTFNFFPPDRGSELPHIIAQEKQLASRLKQDLIFIVCIGPHLFREWRPDYLLELEHQLVSNYSNLVNFAKFQFEINHVPFRFIPVTPAHSCELFRPEGRIFWNATGQYHYDHVPAMNRALYSLLPSNLILPTFDALDQRPEAHNWSDCLHFCMPGALQILPIFLSHLFLIDKL